MFSLFNRLRNVLPAPEAKTAIFIGAILSAALAFANEQDSDKGHYLAQDVIQRILRLTESSTTDEEWHENQAKVREWTNLFFSPLYRPKERCEILTRLNRSDLLSFYSEIYESDATALGPCQKNLKSRIEDYLSERNALLQQSYSQIAKKYLTSCGEQKTEIFGPENDLFVESSTTPVLVGNNHPACGLTLTFDDGPHPTLTEKLLETLKANDLLVNFFVVGTRVQNRPDLVLKAHQEGHLIGNHTQSHLDLRRQNQNAAIEEIELGYKRIFDVVQTFLPFFRFPYGASTPALRNYLQTNGHVEFFWNIDTRDWAIKDPVELFTYSLKQINNAQRGVILYHDIQPQTITMMPYLLSTLASAGYQPYLVRPQSSSGAKKRNVH